MSIKNDKISNSDIKFRNSIDGLWDLAIGLALLIVGFSFLFDAVAIAGGLCFSIYLLILGIKQKVVYPRIGYVEHKGMGQKTRKTMTLTLVVGVVMLIAAFLLYLKLGSGENSEIIRNIISNYGGIILGLVISFLIIVIAKAFSISRFYWYSPLLFLTFLSTNIFNHDYIIPISFLTCGIILLIIGLTIFIKFTKTYPKLEEDAYE